MCLLRRSILLLIVSLVVCISILPKSIVKADSDYDDSPASSPLQQGALQDLDREGVVESPGAYIVIAYNDLGMHCTNEDHSVLSILPPYNTLVAQVIQRGEEPRIITQGIVVEYRLLQNTTCQGINFWDYTGELFGESLPFCTGLTGKTLVGTMELEGDRFIARGLPLTPFDDDGSFNPYPIVEVVVKDAQTGAILARTTTVAPVSHEMNCQKCHGGNGGQDTMLNILRKHDEKEGTRLVNHTPVLCQSCHADPALQMEGTPGVPSFSLAMHGKHAKVAPQPGCYDCHPGPVTKCLRTAIEGMQNCESCHGSLQEMATSLRNGRRPWLDEPKCSNCHQGLEMDTGTRLYRDAKGHHGVYCATCHYEPHAWWPSLLAKDNRQVTLLQGKPGPLGKSCLVCHTALPDEPGPHGLAPSSGTGVLNIVPSSPLEGSNLLGSPLTSSRVRIPVRKNRKIVLMPEMLVPEERLGERVSLYYMICSTTNSWCSDIVPLGKVTLGHTVLFPIIENPTSITGVPAGVYRIYIGFSSLPDFSDLFYSVYEIELLN